MKTSKVLLFHGIKQSGFPWESRIRRRIWWLQSGCWRQSLSPSR